MKKWVKVVGGSATGLINGLLGAGGGMIVVPILKTSIDAKKAHATSVFIILPICVVSATIYLLSGRVTFADALPYLPFGLIGAGIGSLLLSKIKQGILRKLFALLMIWAAIRLLLR
ncbi:MAG: sulfite exporter TauE/SafE family protein [Bacillota bacterium]|nr:sulfite exporter TauE/SafE family protein [Bacillota bacterium]